MGIALNKSNCIPHSWDNAYKTECMIVTGPSRRVNLSDRSGYRSTLLLRRVGVQRSVTQTLPIFSRFPFNRIPGPFTLHKAGEKGQR